MKKTIYIKAIVFLIFYFIASKSIFLNAFISQSLIIAFLTPMLFGAISGIIFLYLFSHEDFFRFAKLIEKKKIKSEKRLEHKFIKFGRVIASIIIGTVGGPILSALSVHILIAKSPYRYWIVFFSAIPSTIFTMGLAKGTIGLIF